MRYALLPLALMALSSSGQEAEKSDSEPAAPPAILDYYRRHNFVTAFSTREERQVLVENPEAPRDARLARVARLMRQLESHVEPYDPGMTRPSRTASGIAYRSDLLRIMAVQIEDGGARVELERQTLGPSQNLFYVARFGDLTEGDRMPDGDELSALAGADALVWIEVHRWHNANGAWRRAATTMHFIDW